MRLGIIAGVYKVPYTPPPEFIKSVGEKGNIKAMGKNITVKKGKRGGNIISL